MEYALSIKQPWAALVVHGRKTIEVRKWPTKLRGRILIHAARVPDDRPEAQALFTPELAETTRRRGGIIGAVDLTACTVYRTLGQFAADQTRHLNALQWFELPGRFGFRFENPILLPFHACTGNVRFFRVEVPPPPPPILPQTASTTGLLVSVRSAAEALIALLGGADLVDVKDPSRGPLGRADAAVLAAVLREVGGRRPVSAALGELLDDSGPPPPGLAFVKWGLAGCRCVSHWPRRLLRAAERLPIGCRPVAVAYADADRANAPPPEEVAAFVATHPGWGFLLDTWGKDGSTLLNWRTVDELNHLCRLCRDADAPVALAGSLGPDEIARLALLRPDWFAVRGAVCKERDRSGLVDVVAVRRMADVVRLATRSVG